MEQIRSPFIINVTRVEENKILYSYFFLAAVKGQKKIKKRFDFLIKICYNIIILYNINFK